MAYMDKPDRAPNIVPRGAIRLSEAFEALCRRLEPAWQDLQQRCVQWDEHLDNDIDERGEDPYPQLVAATYNAEMVFRTALRDGDLRAYVHNLRTGIDLELQAREWGRAGEAVGIHSDYIDQRTPGPDCRLDGVSHPVFLMKAAFDNWLGGSKSVGASISNGDSGSGPSVPPATRAFSVEEVMERTGLSKTKLYEEIDKRNLLAKKCGVRTLILESDLDQFLRRLPGV
jgi:excisionase family DNA binding protein